MKRHNYTRAKRAKYSRYRCRCQHCGARRTLTKLPGFYDPPPKCHGCGKRDWRVDWYRTTRLESRAHNCRCDGLLFDPHRKGSVGTFRKVGRYPMACVHASLS